MTQTIAVFGAGPALGLSVARRFGREGFHVALVSRSQAKLDQLAADLARDGIAATALAADMEEPESAIRAADEITTKLGPIHVLEYGPGSVETPVVHARDLDAAGLESTLNLRLRTPIALAHRVLPGMLERGAGALLFAFGTQPRRPDPMIGNVGAAQAALLHHVHNLNASVADHGVYVGGLLIGGLIEGSAIQRLLARGEAAHLPPEAADVVYPVVHPDDLADLYWDMYTMRDRVEEIVEPSLA